MGVFGEGFIKVRPDTAGFSHEAKEGVLGPIKEVAKLATGALAIGGGVKFLEESIKNASQFQERMSAVDQTLKQSGQGTEEAKKKAENYVDALSKLSGFAKGEVAASLQRADQGTQNLGKAMQVETIAANLARSRHADLAQTTLLVTKAFAGNTTGLKRLGISFDPVTKATDAYKEKVKDLQAKIAGETGATKKADQARLVSLKSTKDAATAADKTATGLAVQARLAKIAEGGMKSYGETTAGKIAKAKNAIDDLQIEIGTALLPIIGKLADFGTKQIERLQEGWPEIKKQAQDAIRPLVPIFDEIRDVIDQVISKLGGGSAAIKDIGIAIAGFVVISKTIQVATLLYEGLTTAIFLARNAQVALDVALESNPIGIVITALALLAAGIYLAYTRSATFRQIVHDAWVYIQEGVNAAMPVIRAALKFLQDSFNAIAPIVANVATKVVAAVANIVTEVRTHWAQIKGVLGPPISAAVTLVKGYFQALYDFVSGLITLFGDIFHGRWSQIWGDLVNLVKKPLGDVKTAVTGALNDLRPLAESAAKKVGEKIAAGIKAAPGFLVGLAGDLLSKIGDAVNQILSDALEYGKKIGAQIALGVLDALKGLPGKIAGAVGLGSSSGSTKPPKGTTRGGLPGQGTTEAFLPTSDTFGTILAANFKNASVPDGSYAHGELVRKGGKWTFGAGFRNLTLPVPLKSDISSVVDKWVGSGISPAEASMVKQWWKDHFVGGKIVASGASLADIGKSGQKIGATLTTSIAASTATLGSTLALSLNNQIREAVVQAKQNLTGLTSTFASSIGSIIDATLSGQTLGGTNTTVGAAVAKIAKDAADKQERGLRSTLADAQAAAKTGPELTDANGDPVTPDDVAKQQAALNQAVQDAQDDLDDYLLQAKIDAATAANTIAKQSVSDQLALWTQQFNQGIIDQNTFIADVNGLASQYGAAGTLLGGAFVNEFSAQLQTIIQQIQAIASAAPSNSGVNSLLGNVVRPIDSVIQQAAAAFATVGQDTTNIAKAKADIKAANSTYDSNVKRDRADAKKLANDADVYTKQLAAAQKQLDAATTAQTRDSAILATLKLLLQNAGVDPDTAIAEAAR